MKPYQGIATLTVFRTPLPAAWWWLRFRINHEAGWRRTGLRLATAGVDCGGLGQNGLRQQKYRISANSRAYPRNR